MLFVRHGRTAYNADRRFCGGRSDPPLDARGREQVAALGARLGGEVERVFCSPQLRARETAAALGQATALEGLREIDQGAFEGQAIAPTLAEHAEFFAAWRRDPSALAIPGGGETMTAASARAAAAMAEVHAAIGPAWRGRVIAVVGHQMTHAAFACRALGRPMREWPQFELGNARANLFAWDGDAWSLVARDL